MTALAPPGWPHASSPFHAGEQAAQQRAGVHERMAEIGPRVLRGVLPVQHRAFFPLLPFLAIGALDAAGTLQATLLAGAPGFVRSPAETALRVARLPPPGDPLAGALRPGAAIGLLGIELHTRRRNRANGRVAAVDGEGFDVQVLQSFGNCPKYIHPRMLTAGPAVEAAPRAGPLDARAAALLRRADTFFVASHVAGDAPNAGADISHRGGPPGFVRVDEAAQTITWPDYSGNFFFNTIGNLLVDPRAALVVPDFASGDLLHVTGRAHVVWHGAEVDAVEGAQRLLRLHVDTTLYRPQALALRER